MFAPRIVAHAHCFHRRHRLPLVPRHPASALRAGLLALLAGLALAPAALAQSVRISEIMHHPPGDDLRAQWIELHNPGSAAVTLTGWRLSRAVELVFTNATRLEPGAFLIVAADVAAFTAAHPGITPVSGGWNGFLGFGGDEVRLEDDGGRTVDSVQYSVEGDWAIRRLGAPDSLKKRGWEWYAEHDGHGKSLELVNESLPGDSGQNWDASLIDGGTPGRANSIASSDAAPIVSGIAHAPLVPRSTDPVTITARMRDETSTGSGLTLQWRVDGAADFTRTPMLDDGAHGDGIAGDGVFGAVIPPHADGVVVEFLLEAADAQGHVRTVPRVEPSGDARTAWFVFQVDDSTYAGEQPVFRLILTKAEYDYLATQIWGGEPRSDALVSGTFIATDGVLDGGTTTQCRYLCGFRNRGHGTRTAVPHNFHVAFPGDQPWKGRSGLSLNTHYTHSQQLGSAVFRRAGIPMADSRPVQVRVRGANLAKAGQEQFGSYAANEVVDDRLVQRQFPSDPGGNLYRGIRDMVPGINSVADLAWLGTSPSAYTNAYSKENHATANDWSDFLGLLDVLNNVPDSNYVAEVRRVVDVDQWMRYFAVNTLLDNQENSLANGSGDDFALYRGTVDTRFRLLPYDMDSVMGRGTRDTTYADGLWRMTGVAVINRFMKRPEFVPFYFLHLKELAETDFAPARMNPLLDQLLGSYVEPGAIANLKAFNASHVAHVLSQFPRELTVSHSLPIVSGYPRTTSATVALHGTGDAIATRRVVVNGSPATWSAWQGTWTNAAVALHPGLNRVRVEAFDENDADAGRTTIDLWFDDGSVQSVSGTVSGAVTWTAAGGPYQVTSSLTVASGATLTIEAGTTVYPGSGVNLTVANGGRLVAVGTEDAPIRFGVAPGSTAKWGGMTINGGAGSPETHVAWAHFEGNDSTAIHSSGGTVWLEHLTFGSTGVQYVSLDSSSFVVSDCVFPTGTAAFELVHGTGGIKAGGRGLFLRNLFGVTTGYNDVVDFTGGQRPNQPIVQFIDNVFLGTSDDELDLDGTDAWVEGNIFLHVHKNGAPDSSSAVSGGSSGGEVSSVTIVGNLFYDCDQAATAKQGNFYTLLNNTIVHQTHAGGLDTEGAVINFADEGTTEGAGAWLEGNVIVDIEKLTRNHVAAQVTFTNNLMPHVWTGPGGGNSTADPLLEHVPSMNETLFTSFEAAQVLRKWFRLRPGSPALGAGPNGRDLGGVVPIGVSISGAPKGTTRSDAATLRVGTVLTGGGIPPAGFPEGSGYTHYQYRFDGGPWNAETPVGVPVQLSGLTAGSHRVEVIGRRDSGLLQNDPVFGTDATVSATATWVVDPQWVAPSRPAVRLSEVLAFNTAIPGDLGTTPDLVELQNFGTTEVDLSGMGLTDDAGEPYKFVFPTGTSLAPGAFLVVEARAGAGGVRPHTGFALKQSGDDLSLFASPAAGGGLLDTVSFGLQVANLSIGRLPGDVWGLCQPTPGALNRAVRTGDAARLRINEWLTDAQFVAGNDFVELWNPEAAPVALGGLWLSDAAGAPSRHVIAPLSFIAGRGFAEFIADGDAGAGPAHLGFRLSPDVGVLRLSAADGTAIDAVNYGTQRTDVSAGRSPNGSDTIAFFAQPTPGAGNPGATLGECRLATSTVSLLPLGASWKYQQTSNLDGSNWKRPEYDDSAWPSGPALLAVETSTLPGPGKRTSLTIGRTTYYFRTHFVVETNLDGFALNLGMAVDDGAIVYLNGTPILTNTMPAGAATYATFASRTVDNAVLESFSVPATALVPGTNVIAAEVHQVNAGSTDIAWGLGIDATRTWTNCTPGTALSVVLNEVLADNRSFTNAAGRASDFVEILNTGTAPVNLEGLSLTDDAGFPGKWLFPAGSVLAPGAFRVVECEPGLPPSAENTGFGLSARGGAVYLFAGAGGEGALVDAVQYGFQAADHSVARLPSGSGPWNLAVPTPGAANVAAGLGSVSALRVNEWMADPSEAGDWLEVCNTGSQPVAMGGLYLTDDLGDRTQSRIAPLSFIGAGSLGFRQIFADGTPEAGADHVSFSLKRGGEALGIYSPSGLLLDGLTFGAQTTGVSEGRFPDGSATFVSFVRTPSPGLANRLPLAAPRINEVLTHTDPPLEDAIELHNPTATPLNLGGWYLSNAATEPRKFRIPDDTIIPANGYVVFHELDFNSGPGAFTLNSAHGDAVVLSQADAQGNLTGFTDEVRFGAAANGVSFGRVETIGGVDFTALAARTFGEDAASTVEQFRTGRGAPNAAPKVGPVVVSEVHYHPAPDGLESPDDEFVELENISANTVALYDPAASTNTWALRDAVAFEFPSGLSLAAGARLLVVGFPDTDAARVSAFRARWNVPDAVPILGPWSGRLANDRDSVELTRPDVVQLPPHPDAGFVPRILVDQVHYAASTPWPAGAATGTNSLQRIRSEAYGNDPANWRAAAPTPGRPNAGGNPDSDGDGMDDAWERTWFGTLARDGSGDFDGDGMTDLEEFRSGTNPTSSAEALRFLAITAGSPVVLRFQAMAGHSYSVQRTETLAAGDWRNVADVASPAASGPVSVTDPTAGGRSVFYRLVTPAVP